MLFRSVAASLRTAPEDVPARVAALSDTVRRLEKELAEAKKALVLGGSGGAAVEAEDVGGVQFLAQSFDGLDPKELRTLANDARAKLSSGVVAYVTVNEGRGSILVAMSDDLTARMSAVDLVRMAVAALGGPGGGGKPEMAQGGGPDGSKANEALDAIRAAIAG